MSLTLTKNNEFCLPGQTELKTIDLSGLTTDQKKRYLEECKLELILIAIDYIAINSREKALKGTILEQEAYRKVSAASDKFRGNPLPKVAKNVLKGKHFFDTLSLVSPEVKQEVESLMEICNER